MSDVLWSDERIDTVRRSLVASEMLNNTDAWHKRMIAAIKWVDEIATAIAEKDAELAQLRATLAYERENVDKVLTVTRMQRDELAALRAELTEATSQSVQPGGRFLLYPEIEKMLSDAFEKGRKFERGESDE